MLLYLCSNIHSGPGAHAAASFLYSIFLKNDAKGKPRGESAQARVRKGFPRVVVKLGLEGEEE